MDTSLSLPNFEPESVRLIKCIHVNLLNSTLEQCKFIRLTADCEDDNGLINYNELLYCYLGIENKLFSVALSVFWLIILFTGLGTTADEFLCPSLLVISNSLKLSQNIAGVTFLAFGNGAPDIFSSLAGIQQERPELVIGELFGGGIFVTGVIVGSILISQDFKVMERPLLRDAFFYLMATFLVWSIFWMGEIRLAHAIGFIGLYVLYIITVIIGRLVYTKLIDERRTRSIKSDSVLIELLPAAARSRMSEQFQDLIKNILPVDYLTWTEGSLLSKLCVIWKAPIYFLLTLTIPVVDYECPKNNWCRMLNSFHCISGPVCILILSGNAFIVLGNVPLLLPCIMLGLMTAIALFNTTEFEVPPKHHGAFAFLGFAVSVMWIYGLANEVVDLLQAIGIMFNLSDVILGITVLAWGNSIGDFVSNLNMARQGNTIYPMDERFSKYINDDFILSFLLCRPSLGYPRMGISACFGGPLLNLLLGIGIPYTIVIVRDGQTLKLEYNKMVTLSYTVLTFSIVATIFILIFTGFRSRKFHGIFLVILYMFYISFEILVELKYL